MLVEAGGDGSEMFDLAEESLYCDVGKGSRAATLMFATWCGGS